MTVMETELAARPKIAATGLRMTFPSARGIPPSAVLHDVSLSVPHGGFVSILGPTGCGKTTLLRVLAGLLVPDSGEVRVDGRVVTNPDSDRAIIFQEYGLFEWKTVIENVAFGLKAKGIGRSDRLARAQRYVDMVHLSGAENRYPSELSGGMKQRAAIARAFAVEPECVLMDEPFAALDAQTRVVLHEEILDIWEKTRKSILLVTHDVEEAVFLSDTVLVMSRQPARVVKSVTVDLPRPRSKHVRSSTAFRRIVDDLWMTLTAVSATPI